MRLPRQTIPRDKRMLAIAMHRWIVIVAEIKAVKAFAVRLVLIEAQKWDRPHILLDPFSIHIADLQLRIKIARLEDFKSVAVLIVLARDISCEGISAICPPETRAFIRIKRQGLLLHSLAAICLHS